jgi:hypothetical protein
MNDPIEKLRNSIALLREEIIHHKVYGAIENLTELRIFMHYHVYAVWDFMSLLKTLQNNLTCTSVPWFPKGLADTRYLINEIVIGEESDVDAHGVRKSHFELYLDAMQQCGADSHSMYQFIDILKKSNDFSMAYQAANTPKEASEFVDFTFKIIHSNKPHLQSAIFTFGREDLIPNMFISLVNDIHKNFPESISTFKYYLERHIEVDGDSHSHLAMQMTQNLCEENEEYWKEVEMVVKESLEKRIRLWDGVYHQIMMLKNQTEQV